MKRILVGLAPLASWMASSKTRLGLTPAVKLDLTWKDALPGMEISLLSYLQLYYRKEML